MKGPTTLTMMMFLALALVAYAEAAPRAARPSLANFFDKNTDMPTCGLGAHFSSFHHACAPTRRVALHDH